MNKDMPFLGCFGAILEEVKCFELIFILNIHILRSMDGCFTVTLAQGTNSCLFYNAIRQVHIHKSL